MNCNHIFHKFHKSCTITITNIAQSKSTQETSLAITIKKQVLHNQETSFCNHNPETIASTTLPQSRRPPLPPVGSAAPRASGRLCAPHRVGRPRSPGRGDRPAPGGRAPPPRAAEAARSAASGPYSTCATAGGGASALPPQAPAWRRERSCEIEIG